MSFFLNLPIGKKLLVTFSLMALVVLGLGLFSIKQLDLVNYSSTVIVEKHLPRLLLVNAIDVKLSDFRRRQLRMLEQHSAAETQKYAERLQQDQAAIEKSVDGLQSQDQDSEQRSIITTLTSQWQAYAAQQQQMSALAQQANLAAAAELLNGPGDEQFRAMKETLTSSPTFALRVSGGGFPLLGDSCSRSTWFLLHRAA